MSLATITHSARPDAVIKDRYSYIKYNVYSRIIVTSGLWDV